MINFIMKVNFCALLSDWDWFKEKQTQDDKHATMKFNLLNINDINLIDYPYFKVIPFQQATTEAISQQKMELYNGRCKSLHQDNRCDVGHKVFLRRK